MRLISAAIGPLEEVGLEVITELGRPTILVGPNNSGKSRLLDLFEALLGTRRPEYHHSLAEDIVSRRQAAETAAEALWPTLELELDQLNAPGSWDREFFAMHVGPYVISPSGEASGTPPEAAIAQSLDLLARALEDEPPWAGQSALEPLRDDYFRYLEQVMSACRYVITGVAIDTWPLSHTPAVRPEELPWETWELARSLGEILRIGERGQPYSDLLGRSVMAFLGRDDESNSLVSAGLEVCNEHTYTTCAFPDFEIIRFGPESPSIRRLLRQLAECVLDLEGIFRPERAESSVQGVYGTGDAVVRLRHEGALEGWSERLTDLMRLHTPDFAAGGYGPTVELTANFLGDREVALEVSLSDDAEIHLGSGLRNWHAYALARTAAETRRRRRIVPGKSELEPPSDKDVSTERPLLLLFDEPEAHLHARLRGAVAEWMAMESDKPNQTVIVATHAAEFLSLRTSDKRIVPLAESRGQTMPSGLAELLTLAGADAADLPRVARGFFLVEGKHERQIYSACFGKVLQEAVVEIVVLSGAFGAAGQTDFLATHYGKPVAVLFDRVRAEVLEGKWVEGKLSAEEEEVATIRRMGIPNLRFVSFPAHDVIQAIPEDVIRRSLVKLKLQAKTDSWSWEDVVRRYDSEVAKIDAGRRKPKFAKVLLQFLGVYPAWKENIKWWDRLDEIVDEACHIMAAEALAPPLLKAAFSQAMAFLDPGLSPEDF